MQTDGDRHHEETPLDAPRTFPARLESALRRKGRDQCVTRAAFGHRRVHGATTCSIRRCWDWTARGGAPSRVRREYGADARLSRHRSNACATNAAHARNDYFRFAPARTRFRWKASIASTTGSLSKRTGSVVGSPVCLRVLSIAARAARTLRSYVFSATAITGAGRR